MIENERRAGTIWYILHFLNELAIQRQCSNKGNNNYASVELLSRTILDMPSQNSIDKCIIDACYMSFPYSPIPAYVDIALWSSLVLVCIIGIPISIAFVFYDWYGGDPQKRSLGNQILSVGSLTHISSTIFCYLFIILLRKVCNAPKQYISQTPDNDSCFSVDMMLVITGQSWQLLSCFGLQRAHC